MRRKKKQKKKKKGRGKKENEGGKIIHDSDKKIQNYSYSHLRSYFSLLGVIVFFSSFSKKNQFKTKKNISHLKKKKNNFPIANPIFPYPIQRCRSHQARSCDDLKEEKIKEILKRLCKFFSYSLLTRRVHEHLVAEKKKEKNKRNKRTISETCQCCEGKTQKNQNFLFFEFFFFSIL